MIPLETFMTYCAKQRLVVQQDWVDDVETLWEHAGFHSGAIEPEVLYLSASVATFAITGSSEYISEHKFEMYTLMGWSVT